MRKPQLHSNSSALIPAALAGVCLMAAACAPQSAVLTSGEYIAFVSESTSVTLRKEQLKLDDYADYWQIDCRAFNEVDRALATRLDDRLELCGRTDDPDDADPDCSQYDEFSGSEQEDRCIEDHIFFTDTDEEEDYPYWPTDDPKLWEEPVYDEAVFGVEQPDTQDHDDDNDGFPDYLDCDDDDPSEGPGAFLQLGGGSGSGEIHDPDDVAEVVAAGDGFYFKRSDDLYGDQPSEMIDAPGNPAFFIALGPETCEDGGDGFWPPRQELWLNQDGYEVVTEEMDPWRGEGIVTHEGDLLVGFHHAMPGSADLRFQFAIDRYFQPTECVVGDDGEVVGAALDGDWIQEWSDDILGEIASLQGDDEAFAPYSHLEPYLPNDDGEGGGRLWLLNAGSYQFDPEEGSDFWYLPEQWESGAAQGFFGEDRLANRIPLFIEPELYDLFTTQGIEEGSIGAVGDAFQYLYLYCDEQQGAVYEERTLENGEVIEPSLCQDYFDFRMEFIADQARAEAAHVMRSSLDDDPGSAWSYRPITHRNKWRPMDGVGAGFDAWSELHYSYVVFSADSDLRVGGRAEGAFTLALDGSDTNSRVIVKGQFEIPKIKRDTWAPADLREEKREEAGLDFCAY